MYKKSQVSNKNRDSKVKHWKSLKKSERSRIVSSILNKETTLRKVSLAYKIHRRTVTKWVNEARIARMENNGEFHEEKSLILRMKKKEADTSESKNNRLLMDALKRERLKNEALLEMIKIAEQNFKIKIRKKAGGRQCKSCDKDTQG